jgi:hypothetical protein
MSNMFRIAMSSHLPASRLVCVPQNLPRWQDTLTPPYVEDFNPVFVIYRKPMFKTDKLLRMVGAGGFTHCELYVPSMKATFAIFAGGHMECSTSLPRFYESNPEYFTWHMMILTDGEMRKLEKWHVDMVQKKCDYNFKDLFWKMTPSLVQQSCVPDVSTDVAHSPQKMFCSQAVILGLREAFGGPDTKTFLKDLFGSVNSRITTPSQLEKHLAKCQKVSSNTRQVPLTFWDAREEFITNTPYGFKRDQFPCLLDLKCEST